MDARGGGGSLKELVHNPRLQFFTLDRSKIEVFKTHLFDTVIPLNDYPRHVTHVLGRVYVFFTLFGYWVQGGGSDRIGAQPAYATFQPIQLNYRSF